MLLKAAERDVKTAEEEDARSKPPTDEEIATPKTTIEQVVAATLKRKRENGVLYIVERIKECFEPNVPLFQVIHDLGGDAANALIKICNKHEVGPSMLQQMVATHFEDPEFMKEKRKEL